MRNSTLSLFLGLTATAVVLTPLTVEAQTYDYSRAENLSARPIESNNILSFFGDQAQNEGYIIFRNADPNAPDAGHIGFTPNAQNAAYYVAGREDSPDLSGATRSATLENTTGFPNFLNYLNSNNIPLSSIGFTFGPKSDRDLTQTWNLGEDKLGQDWFGSPGSSVEEFIYLANPDDVENFVTLGTNNIVSVGYSPLYFISDTDYNGTYQNILLTDPAPASKVPGLDPLASGLADAFLQDVAAAGGGVQQFYQDQPQASDISVSVSQGYTIDAVSFPLELRAVPEPSSTLGLLMFGALGAVSYLKKQKNKRNSSI